MRDNAQLRQACTYRNFLNDTIDAWKLEPVEVGDPPRYTSRLSIIFQLHKQWGLIKSFTSEMIVWKEDMISGNESEQLRSYDDMLEAADMISGNESEQLRSYDDMLEALYA